MTSALDAIGIVLRDLSGRGRHLVPPRGEVELLAAEVMMVLDHGVHPAYVLPRGKARIADGRGCSAPRTRDA